MGCDLPRTQTFKYADEPQAINQVEFRLIYKGALPADTGKGGRAVYKQRIRKEFHKQLRELWRQHPELKRQAETHFVTFTTPPNQVSPPGPGVRQIVRADDIKVLPSSTQVGAKTWVEHIADEYARLGGRFVPLISKRGGFTCTLDILFLRRDAPGNIIVKGAGGGDIDNRIKLLLDGLKLPEVQSDLGGLDLEPDEDPFFCLMEDDDLITRISVTSDRLLLPLQETEKTNDVHIIVHVTMSDESSIFLADRLV